MKNNLLVIATFFLMSACASKTAEVQSNVNKQTETQKTEVSIAKDVSIEEYKMLISDETIILDVRTPEEFAQGHLEGAVNINFFDENFIQKVSELNKSKALLIHCAAGGRSAKAMNALKGKGFSKMYNMLGGYSAWLSAGYPVVK